MIREVKFESQDRRIKGIIEALNANGIKDIEEANAICEAHGLDPYKTCVISVNLLNNVIAYQHFEISFLSFAR